MTSPTSLCPQSGGPALRTLSCLRPRRLASLAGSSRRWVWTEEQAYQPFPLPPPAPPSCSRQTHCSVDDCTLLLPSMRTLPLGSLRPVVPHCAWCWGGAAPMLWTLGAGLWPPAGQALQGALDRRWQASRAGHTFSPGPWLWAQEGWCRRMPQLCWVIRQMGWMVGVGSGRSLSLFYR